VVAVSVPPLAWMVERLAAEAVEIVVMLPPSAEAETYEPTPQQMRALAACALYVEVGHPLFTLEAGFVEPFLERHPGIARVRLSRARPAPQPPDGGPPPGHSEHPGHAAHDDDPHAWLSLRVLRGALPDLARALAGMLPAAAGTIGERERRLDAELAALDAELGTRLTAAAAARGRRFLIHHPALGFLAADYGLVQVALEHEGKDPSPRQLARTLAEARAGGAQVVLATRGTPSRAAEVAARELGGRVVEVDPLGRDWPAALRALTASLAEALYR
jgi:zinc transport system substrate-binding protein